jgi:hypothetical protein
MKTMMNNIRVKYSQLNLVQKFFIRFAVLTIGITSIEILLFRRDIDTILPVAVIFAFGVEFIRIAVHFFHPQNKA